MTDPVTVLFAAVALTAAVCFVGIVVFSRFAKASTDVLGVWVGLCVVFGVLFTHIAVDTAFKLMAVRMP